MKVLLFASVAEGHQLILHARTILHECHRRGWTTHLVVPEAVTQHKTWPVLQAEFGDKLTFSLMPNPHPEVKKWPFLNEFRRILVPDFAHRKAYLTGLAESRKVFTPDAIYMVNFESLERSVAILGFDAGGTPLTGMLMGRSFHYAPMGIPVPMGKFESIFSPKFFRRFLRRKELTKLAIIDPLLEEYIQKEKLPGGEKVTFVPDIGKLMVVPREQSLHAELGIASDEFVLLSFGWLHPRKGIAEILAAMDHAEWPEKARVLMVGSARPEAKVLLESDSAKRHMASGRLIVKEGFADDLIEGRAFATADAIWLGYKGHWTMSGVLVQACIAGKPVVAMNQGLIGWYTRRYNIGVEVDIDSPASIGEGIRKLMDSPELVRSCAESASAIAQLHEPGSFERNICNLIETAVSKNTRA
ncbi:MAG: glycosyltransferase [Chthonomonas sp.]|nr:glycosyltransferase [Chthonomonas sp.]